jgi:hypothetical protein
MRTCAARSTTMVRRALGPVRPEAVPPAPKRCTASTGPRCPRSTLATPSSPNAHGGSVGSSGGGLRCVGASLVSTRGRSSQPSTASTGAEINTRVTAAPWTYGSHGRAVAIAVDVAGICSASIGERISTSASINAAMLGYRSLGSTDNPSSNSSNSASGTEGAPQGTRGWPETIAENRAAGVLPSNGWQRKIVSQRAAHHAH